MKTIYEGVLSKSGQTFNVQRLSLSNINQVLQLQKVVVDTLENKEILQPLSLEEFQFMMEGNGLVLGVFVDEQLIAFRALLVPPLDDEHLGKAIGLADEELSSVIYQEISNVHPSFRGNGLQKILGSMVMQELEKLPEKYSYVCCTVAPFNVPSLKDKFAQGMEIAALKEVYGDWMRYIFVKELAESHEGEWLENITLPMEDVAGQQKLLKDGWRGFQMENNDGMLQVVFRKKVQ